MNNGEPTVWLALAAAFLIGGLIGGAIVYAMRRGRSKADAEAQAAEAKYREQVAEHFVATAKLVDGLTDSYKSLFDHLQTGAGELLDEDTLQRRLAEDDRVIMLNRLGRPKDPLGADETAEPEPQPEPEPSSEPEVVEVTEDATPESEESEVEAVDATVAGEDSETIVEPPVGPIKSESLESLEVQPADGVIEVSESTARAEDVDGDSSHIGETNRTH